MEGLQEDTGDGSMQCTEHPFKTNSPAGGICALCLQNKLTKLVSSSFPIAVFPSSSPSSPPSITIPPNPNPNPNPQITPPKINCHHHQYHPNRSKILYLLTQKKKKAKDHNFIISGEDRTKNLAFKRSKSTAGGFSYNDGDLNSPHKRGFWSFIHSQKHTNSSFSNTKPLRGISSNTLCAPGNFPQIQRSEREIIVVEENESPTQGSFDRKVSRSRSVGCGSRSFSGDFFERISTGFGDCTLRRVESNREGKMKIKIKSSGGRSDCIKERVRCGGLFAGFMMTSSSSSSSDWGAKESDVSGIGKVTSASERGGRSWGWTLASPMRAFSKPLGTNNNKPLGSNNKKETKNQSPNLGAIPSLLSVRS